DELDLIIIFVTSHADRNTVMRASAAKPNGYLVKPFTKEGLFAAIESAKANFVPDQGQADYDRLNEATQSSQLSKVALQTVQRYIEKNFDRDIHVGDLAA
ncbi:MAG: hypothetical protein AAF205_08785, partial [Pseudomonadota bacterium]